MAVVVAYLSFANLLELRTRISIVQAKEKCQNPKLLAIHNTIIKKNNRFLTLPPYFTVMNIPSERLFLQ